MNLPIIQTRQLAAYTAHAPLPCMHFKKHHSSLKQHPTKPPVRCASSSATVETAEATIQQPTCNTAAVRKAKITGPTAVITGGSQGVGRVLALELAKEGYNIVVVARQPDRLQASAEAAQALAVRPSSCMAIPCDITNPDQVAALAKEVADRYETVNLVVCNAGVCMRGDWDACTLEDYQSQLSVNFLGTVSVAQAFMPQLLNAAKQNMKPTIAVVNSCAGRLPIKQMSAYTASKFALAGWVDAIRNELAAKGIDITTVHPGIVKTNFLERAQFIGESASAAQSEMRALLDSNVPLVQTPEQVAAAVVDAVKNRKNEIMVGAPYAAMQATYKLTGFNPMAL